MAEKRDLTRVRLQKGLYIVKRGARWTADRRVQGLQTRWSSGTATKKQLPERARRPRPVQGVGFRTISTCCQRSRSRVFS
jgi:hypothetical protein